MAFNGVYDMTEIKAYRVAEVARSKLLASARSSNQNLRRIVAHAKLYDGLLAELDRAKQDTDMNFSTDDKTRSKVDQARSIETCTEILDDDADDEQDEWDEATITDASCYKKDQSIMSPREITTKCLVVVEELDAEDDDSDTEDDLLEEHNIPQLESDSDSDSCDLVSDEEIVPLQRAQTGFMAQGRQIQWQGV